MERAAKAALETDGKVRIVHVGCGVNALLNPQNVYIQYVTMTA